MQVWETVDVGKTIDTLLKLQEVDYEIYLIVKEREKKQAPIAAMRKQTEAEEQSINRQNEGLKQLTTQIEMLENKQMTLEGKISELNEKISEVKTKKELEALENEIEFLRDEKKNIFEEYQERKVEQKGLKETLDESTQNLEDLRQKIESEESAIKDEMTELDSRQAEEEGKRPEISKGLDNRIYHEYERIRSRIPGPWVVGVYNQEACSGCYMKMPTQTINNIMRKEHIIRCQNCTRIVYYDDEE